eukprot:m51a1_g10024 hypothetical protein (254) ;mRNA; f:101176-101937
MNVCDRIKDRLPPGTFEQLLSLARASGLRTPRDVDALRPLFGPHRDLLDDFVRMFSPPPASPAASSATSSTTSAAASPRPYSEVLRAVRDDLRGLGGVAAAALARLDAVVARPPADVRAAVVEAVREFPSAAAKAAALAAQPPPPQIPVSGVSRFAGICADSSAKESRSSSPTPDKAAPAQQQQQQVAVDPEELERARGVVEGAIAALDWAQAALEERDVEIARLRAALVAHGIDAEAEPPLKRAKTGTSPSS